MKIKNSQNKIGHRTVAANLNPHAVGPVLTPAVAASLLKNCGDPLATLNLALQLFAGLHPTEVEYLKWRAFEYRGWIDTYRILANPHRPAVPTHCIRTVQFLVVLEPWLEPFALRTDAVCFDETVKRHAAEALHAAGIKNAATLRHTFISNVFNQIARPSDWLNYCSIDREDIQDRLIPSISKEDVESMFALTPKKVGIRNWAQRVDCAMKSLGKTTGITRCA